MSEGNLRIREPGQVGQWVTLALVILGARAPLKLSPLFCGRVLWPDPTVITPAPAVLPRRPHPNPYPPKTVTSVGLRISVGYVSVFVNESVK